MRRALVLLALLLSCGGSAFAQGYIHRDIVLAATGRPVAGATVTVCTSAATGIPCTPTATIYTDETLGTVDSTNPFTTDGRGNFDFSVPFGSTFVVTITGSGITGYSYRVTTTTPITFTSLQPDVTGRDLGATGARWDAFLETTTTYGTTAPNATGIDLGTTSARYDAFLEATTTYGTTAPNTTGVDLGTTGARYDAFLEGLNVASTATGSVDITGSPTGTAEAHIVDVRANAADPHVEFQRAQGAQTAANVIASSLSVPASATNQNFNAFAAFVDNNAASKLNGGSNAVAGYFQAFADANDSETWALNLVIQDVAGRTGAIMQGIEVDVNANNTGTEVYGINLVGASTVSPTVAQALAVGLLGSGVKWSHGFVSVDAATNLGIQLGTKDTGNAVPSQDILLISRDSGGTLHSSTINTTSLGHLLLAPASTKSVQVQNGILSDGTGLKHGRVTTGSITNGSSAAVTLTWATAFADANYTVNCSVVEADADALTLEVDHLEAVIAASVTVRVTNDDGAAAKTGTLHCTGFHD